MQSAVKTPWIPWVPYILKGEGNWEYQVRTAKPHNPAGEMGKHICTVNHSPQMDPEGMMNLIAAAPDLLEACKAVIANQRAIDSLDHIGTSLVDTLRAAIAKAEGK